MYTPKAIKPLYYCDEIPMYVVILVYSRNISQITSKGYYGVSVSLFIVCIYNDTEKYCSFRVTKPMKRIPQKNCCRKDCLLRLENYRHYKTHGDIQIFKFVAKFVIITSLKPTGILLVTPCLLTRIREFIHMQHPEGQEWYCDAKCG